MDMQSDQYVMARKEAKDLLVGDAIVLEDEPARVTAVHFTSVPGRRAYECGIVAIGIFTGQDYMFNVLKKKKFSIARVVVTQSCDVTGTGNGMATVMKNGNTYLVNMPPDDELAGWITRMVDQGEHVSVNCFSAMGKNQICG